MKQVMLWQNEDFRDTLKEKKAFPILQGYQHSDERINTVDRETMKDKVH